MIERPLLHIAPCFFHKHPIAQGLVRAADLADLEGEESVSKGGFVVYGPFHGGVLGKTRGLSGTAAGVHEFRFFKRKRNATKQRCFSSSLPQRE